MSVDHKELKASFVKMKSKIEEFSKDLEWLCSKVKEKGWGTEVVDCIHRLVRIQKFQNRLARLMADMFLCELDKSPQIPQDFQKALLRFRKLEGDLMRLLRKAEVASSPKYS